jgi:helicase
MSAHAIKTALDDNEPPQDGHTPFGLFQLIGSLPDMNAFFLRRSDVSWVSDLGERHRDELYFPQPEEQERMDDWLSSLKTAAVLMLWVRETPDNEMYQKFDIYPGDLRNRVDLAQWLLYSALELAKLWESPAVPVIDDTMRRVRYGVLPELLDMCRIPGIGRVRARMLYRGGLRTLDDIATADVSELASVERIGRVLAKEVKAEARRRSGRGAARDAGAGEDTEPAGVSPHPSEESFEIPGVKLGNTGSGGEGDHEGEAQEKRPAKRKGKGEGQSSLFDY